MIGSVFVRASVFCLLSLMLGGCGFGSFSDFLSSEKTCSTGSKFEQATCLTYEYRDICQAGEFGLRKNLNRLRKLNKNEIGTRICNKRIAIAIGPVISGISVTGTLAAQSAKKEMQCNLAGKRDKILCTARVQLKFLGRQFKAACLATIPWYTANDLMFNTVKIRERVLANAKIEGNEIYSADRKWLCHKNTSVSGLDQPHLKQVYTEPENKVVQVALAQAENECVTARKKTTGSTSSTIQPRTKSQKLDCVLPRAVHNLSLKFTSLCKQKSDPQKKDVALASVVHARKFLAMLHPDHFRKSSFVWLCGKQRSYIKNRFVMASTKELSVEAPVTPKIPLPARTLRQNAHLKARNNRLKRARLMRSRQAKSRKRSRAAAKNTRQANSFSYANATF